MAAPPSLQRVVKRDGFEEQYDPLKLRETLAAALEGVGESEALREQFAITIEMRMGREHGRLVETAALAATAVQVFEEYDCRAAAHAFADYRSSEEECLADLRIHGSGGNRRRGEQVQRPWDRSRLQRSLMRDRHLERAVARLLARRVERRLSCLGFRHLTTRLLAAIADNEARVLGLRADPLEGSSFGFSRAELRAWLGGACLPAMAGGGASPALDDGATDPRPLLGEEVLARFALEELWSPSQREAQLAGDYEVLALGDWTRPLRLWLHPQAEESEEAFWHRVAEAFGHAHEVQVHWPAQHPVTVLSEQAPRWLAAGGRSLRLATSSPQLAASWMAAEQFVAMPVAAFLALSQALQQSLAGYGRLRLQWQPPSRLPNAKERLERSLQAAAVVNLVPPAVEAGAFALEEFLRHCNERLTAAAEALQVLLQRAGAAEGAAVALIPAGLGHALDILLPDAALRRSRGKRLLLDLRPAFERAARRAGLRLDDAFPPHPQAAGTHLAQRDGLELSSAYACGWWPGGELGASLTLGLDAAPWLEGAPEQFAIPACESRLRGLSARQTPRQSSREA